jgi:hypothetical protein
MVDVTEDLRSLVGHVGRMLLVSGLATGVVAVFVFIAGADQLGDNRYANAGIVLSVLAALQAFFWFVLIYWADTHGEPRSDPGRNP